MTTPDPQGQSIEERYELELTRAGLGLVEGQQSFPVGREERFYVEKLLGRGNMGAVYLARDSTLDRPVALKVVTRRLDAEHAKRRLEQEARALARLQHPNVVSVYDLATTEYGELFIAMEYVQGMTLRVWQRDRSLLELLDAYLMAGQGLAAAHAVGCIHRDFKPDNVMIDTSSGVLQVKVADFGVAGLGPAPSEATVATSPGERGVLTSPQGLVGTAAYMAPEQLRREQASERSDQHQFCVALWEAMAGARPFSDEGRDPNKDGGLPKRSRKIPRSLQRVLAKGMAFEQGDRFENMSELMRRLRRIGAWRRARPWVGVSGVVGGVALGLAVWPQPPGMSCEEQAVARIDGIWSLQAREDVEDSISDSEEHRKYITDSIEDIASNLKKENDRICQENQNGTHPIKSANARCIETWITRFQFYIDKLRDLPQKNEDLAYKLIKPLKELYQKDICSLPPIPLDPAVQNSIDEAITLEALGDFEIATMELLQNRTNTSELTECPSANEEDTHSSIEQVAILYQQGNIRVENGDPNDALQQLWDSSLQAKACNDDRRLAKALIRAAALSATDLSKPNQAELMIEFAESAMKSEGIRQDTLLSFERWKAKGLIAQRRGQLERAKGLSAQRRGQNDRAERLNEQKRGQPENSSAHFDEANAHFIEARNHFNEARIYYNSGLSTLNKLDKSKHPILTSKILSNIGTIHHNLGLTHHNTGTIYQKSGKHNLAIAENDLAATEYQLAKEEYKNASRLLDEALGDDHPQSTNRAQHNALNLGILATELGEIAEVRLHLATAAESRDPRLAIRSLTQWLKAEEAYGTRDQASDVAEILDHRLHSADYQGLPVDLIVPAMANLGYILASHENKRGFDLLDEALKRVRNSENIQLEEQVIRARDKAVRKFGKNNNLSSPGTNPTHTNQHAP
ncbi:MAG: serine/threonine-protein kinase [Myxococcota bacterium]